MNKIALITGATAGIGLAIARKLASENFDLVLTGRRGDRLQAIASELTSSFNISVLPLVFDITDRSAVEKAINGLDDKWKNIVVLVNNAGLALGLTSIEDGNMDFWDTMINTNVKGLLYMTRIVSPLLIKNGSGHIINIGSIAGKENYPNGNVYCATKAAVDSLNRSMRIDLAKYPVKVTAIHPGAVETEFSLVRFEGDAQKAEKVYHGYENLVADDIAEAVIFALSRPPHVNINDMIIMPTAQPCATIIHRKPS